MIFVHIDKDKNNISEGLDKASLNKYVPNRLGKITLWNNRKIKLNTRNNLISNFHKLKNISSLLSGRLNQKKSLRNKRFLEKCIMEIGRLIQKEIIKPSDLTPER